MCLTGHFIVSCFCWVALEGKRNSAELIKDLGFGGSILTYPVHLLRSYSLRKGSGTHLEKAVMQRIHGCTLRWRKGTCIKELGSHWTRIKMRKQILSSELPEGTSPAHTLVFAH